MLDLKLPGIDGFEVFRLGIRFEPSWMSQPAPMDWNQPVETNGIDDSQATSCQGIGNLAIALEVATIRQRRLFALRLDVQDPATPSSYCSHFLTDA